MENIVSYKNKIINPVDVHEYYKFYKPKNYVSSRSRQGNSKTIYDLIKNKKLNSDKKNDLNDALLTSIAGISAAMKNTG